MWMLRGRVRCSVVWGSCLPLPLTPLSAFLGLPEQRSLDNYGVFIARVINVWVRSRSESRQHLLANWFIMSRAMTQLRGAHTAALYESTEGPQLMGLVENCMSGTQEGGGLICCCSLWDFSRLCNCVWMYMRTQCVCVCVCKQRTTLAVVPQECLSPSFEIRSHIGLMLAC